jgi:hypothetical protein
MPERHVCTQRYTSELNAVSNIEKTFTAAHRRNGTSNNRDRTVLAFKFTVCLHFASVVGTNCSLTHTTVKLTDSLNSTQINRRCRTILGKLRCLIL